MMEEEVTKSPVKLRSKKGCRTCRIRRVKCDERTPACHRCTSTGRACEWFDLFTNSSKPMPARAPAKNSNTCRGLGPLSPPTEFPDAKALELRGFEFFQHRTAREMCHTFEFGFWRTLVLQLSRSEPAVLHAAIALGTLHEAEESLGMPVSKDRVTHGKHQFAVAQYNTAINMLTRQVSNSHSAAVVAAGAGSAGGGGAGGVVSGSGGGGGAGAGHPNPASSTSMSRALILATCLIFVHIELLRGRYESAIVHIRSALKILHESPQLPHGWEAIMRTALQRLDIQSAHFNHELSAYPETDPGSADLIAPVFDRDFDSIEAGKDRYDMLFSYVHPLTKFCEANVINQRWDHLTDDAMRARQQTLLRLHARFIANCEALERHPASPRTQQFRQGITLLHLHARVTQVQVAVCMEQDTEAAFDHHTREFELIVALSKAYVSGFSHGASPSSSSSSRPPKLPTLSTDWGIILPLTFTALKCRRQAIRNEAVDLLSSWRHREGFWDSSLLAKYARSITEIEGRSIVAPDGTIQRATKVIAYIRDNQSNMTVSWEWSGAGSGAEGGVDTRVPHYHTVTL